MTDLMETKVGGAAVFTVTFRDALQVIADPDIITFEWVGPDDSTGSLIYGIDPEVVKLATGKYVYALPITLPGRWVGGFIGSSVDPLGVNAVAEAIVCGVGSALAVV